MTALARTEDVALRPSADARTFLRDALERAPRDRTIAISIPAPLAPLDAMLRALRKGPSWLFESSGASLAALGSAATIRLGGGAARAAAVRVLGDAFHVVHSDARASALRAFVGFAFAPGSASAPPWEAFGDGIVALPRWTYSVEGASAVLTLAVHRVRPIPVALAMAELDAILAVLEAPEPRAPVVAAPVALQHEDRARWTARIDRIREAIARGDLRKVVAARQAVFTSATDLDPLDVLARIGGTHATKFLVRTRAGTFVGATPEHLFTVRGARIAAEALAGSSAIDAPDASEALLASAKDREEHALVVEHLAARLAPLCSRLVIPDAPRIRRLPNVLHLRTPIEGELAQRVHPLDLVEALHPTPAVCGTPTDRAAAWIADEEPARGWYGGPLGWIDARGDAEIVVALRCALVRGARAIAFAGAGIVAASEPDAEWNETALKLRPMLRALGIEVADSPRRLPDSPGFQLADSPGAEP